MREPCGSDPPSGPADTATWSGDDTGSHLIDRELERELVRAALFDGCPAPRIGRFAVAERLGAGASSVVYAAWDESLARRVAVKIFVTASPATYRQVQHEARALAQLSHRNVVAVYEVGEWHDHAFIAMELIAGTTLARWQTARKRSAAEIMDAYLQAGWGLAAAHRAGLVHRDFKPANVMVASDGRVAVTDFGLAGSAAHEAEATGLPTPISGSAITTRAAIGTPAYVAPEQRRGAIPHPSADIYSFSLALCEALIGWHPMQRAEPAWRAALARRVPRRVYEAICIGLAKQPSARGDTMAPLLDALTPARRTGWQRGTWIALAGLATVMAVVGLDQGRGRIGAPSPSRSLPPPFDAPSLHTLLHRIDAFVAAPPRSDDRAATASLRALLLAPLPTELRCSWPAPLVALALGEDHAVGLDEQGRVHACSLDGGALSLAATGARCIIAGPGGAIGLVDRDRRVRIVRSTGNGWQAVDAVEPAPTLLRQPAPEVACPIVILPEPGGAVRVLEHGDVTADGSGRIVAHATLDDVRIADRAGSELSSHRLPHGRRYPLLGISRDGSRVLAAELHGPVLWWQASTGRWREEPLYFPTPSLRRVRVSPSGVRALLLGYFGALEVRMLGGGRVAWLTSNAITDAVFRDDDTVIASDAEYRLWRWDLARQRAGVVTIHGRTVWSIASNAAIVASASEDGTVAVIDRRTGAPRLELRTATEIYRVVLDGDHLIAAGDDGLRRWSWRTGAPAPLAGGRGLRIWDVEPATDGRARIYLAGALVHGDVFTWTTSARTLVRHGPLPETRVSDVAVSPDGRTAAVVDSAGKLVVLDIVSRQITLEAKAHVGWVRRVAFDPATSTIVTVGDDGYFRTWSPPETTPRRSLRVDPGPVYDLDVHLGHAILGSYGGSVTLVDVATGQIARRYRGHDSPVCTARFRPDGQWFVTGDYAGRACLWRIDDDECHTWLDGHGASVRAATFADDGTVFTASDDGTVRYWRPTYDLPVDAMIAELALRGSRRGSVAGNGATPRAVSPDR